MAGGSGAWAASGWRFAPPRGPGVSPRPIDATAPEVRRLRASALRGIDSAAYIQPPIYKQKRSAPAFGPGVLPRFATQAAPPPVAGASPCSPSAKLLAEEGQPPERRTAASGPARLPRGQSPRRPPLVDSLCRRVSIISILKKLKRDRLFECSSISTASDPTHVCRTAPGLVLKIMTTRIAGGLLLGYNPWKAGARLKTPAFTAFRPDCP